jgi:hypothetical protein
LGIISKTGGSVEHKQHVINQANDMRTEELTWSPHLDENRAVKGMQLHVVVVPVPVFSLHWMELSRFYWFDHQGFRRLQQLIVLYVGIVGGSRSCTALFGSRLSILCCISLCGSWCWCDYGRRR